MHRPGIVHRLIGHAGRHRAIADDSHDIRRLVGEVAATAMPRPAEIEVEEWPAPNGS